MTTRFKDSVAIVGGGAAGFFAAANLAELCPDIPVTLYEAGSKFLGKVEVSGGGRCNVTHNCFDIPKLLSGYPRGNRELRGAFTRFNPEDTVQWFRERGVQLKSESDGRMFPVTDTSATIIECLQKQSDRGAIVKKAKTGVKEIKHDQGKFLLHLIDGSVDEAEYVLLATGSSKSGHGLATSLGHSITPCAPSLFTFKSTDSRLSDLAGTSFSSAKVTLAVGGERFHQTGPLLITHWGLSGPAILKLSAFAARHLQESKYLAHLEVNWIGAVNTEQCKQSLMDSRKKLATKQLASNVHFYLTRRFWERLLSFCSIPFDLHFAELSNAQIELLAMCLTHSDVSVSGKGEFKEEFVTCGGVSLKEIDFKTMESRITANLFFAGEILDVDGITGGYNFQSAWTGGWLAANEIAVRVAL